MLFRSVTLNLAFKLLLMFASSTSPAGNVPAPPGHKTVAQNRDGLYADIASLLASYGILKLTEVSGSEKYTKNPAFAGISVWFANGSFKDCADREAIMLPSQVARSNDELYGTHRSVCNHSLPGGYNCGCSEGVRAILLTHCAQFLKPDDWIRLASFNNLYKVNSANKLLFIADVVPEDGSAHWLHGEGFQARIGNKQLATFRGDVKTYTHEMSECLFDGGVHAGDYSLHFVPIFTKGNSVCMEVKASKFYTGDSTVVVRDNFQENWKVFQGQAWNDSTRSTYPSYGIISEQAWTAMESPIMPSLTSWHTWYKAVLSVIQSKNYNDQIYPRNPYFWVSVVVPNLFAKLASLSSQVLVDPMDATVNDVSLRNIVTQVYRHVLPKISSWTYEDTLDLVSRFVKVAEVTFLVACLIAATMIPGAQLLFIPLVVKLLALLAKPALEMAYSKFRNYMTNVTVEAMLDMDTISNGSEMRDMSRIYTHMSHNVIYGGVLDKIIFFLDYFTANKVNEDETIPVLKGHRFSGPCFCDRCSRRHSACGNCGLTDCGNHVCHSMPKGGIARKIRDVRVFVDNSSKTFALADSPVLAASNNASGTVENKIIPTPSGYVVPNKPLLMSQSVVMSSDGKAYELMSLNIDYPGMASLGVKVPIAHTQFVRTLITRNYCYTHSMLQVHGQRGFSSYDPNPLCADCQVFGRAPAYDAEQLAIWFDDETRFMLNQPQNRDFEVCGDGIAFRASQPLMVRFNGGPTARVCPCGGNHWTRVLPYNGPNTQVASVMFKPISYGWILTADLAGVAPGVIVKNGSGYYSVTSVHRCHHSMFSFGPASHMNLLGNVTVQDFVSIAYAMFGMGCPNCLLNPLCRHVWTNPNIITTPWICDRSIGFAFNNSRGYDVLIGGFDFTKLFDSLDLSGVIKMIQPSNENPYPIVNTSGLNEQALMEFANNAITSDAMTRSHWVRLHNCFINPKFELGEISFEPLGITSSLELGAEFVAVPIYQLPFTPDEVVYYNSFGCITNINQFSDIAVFQFKISGLDNVLKPMPETPKSNFSVLIKNSGLAFLHRRKKMHFKFGPEKKRVPLDTMERQMLKDINKTASDLAFKNCGCAINSIADETDPEDVIYAFRFRDRMSSYFAWAGAENSETALLMWCTNKPYGVIDYVLFWDCLDMLAGFLLANLKFSEGWRIRYDPNQTIGSRLTYIRDEKYFPIPVNLGRFLTIHSKVKYCVEECLFSALTLADMGESANLKLASEREAIYCPLHNKLGMAVPVLVSKWSPFKGGIRTIPNKFKTDCMIELLLALGIKFNITTMSQFDDLHRFMLTTGKHIVVYDLNTSVYRKIGDPKTMNIANIALSSVEEGVMHAEFCKFTPIKETPKTTTSINTNDTKSGSKPDDQPDSSGSDLSESDAETDSSDSASEDSSEESTGGVDKFEALMGAYKGGSSENPLEKRRFTYGYNDDDSEDGEAELIIKDSCTKKYNKPMDLYDCSHSASDSNVFSKTHIPSSVQFGQDHTLEFVECPMLVPKDLVVVFSGNLKVVIYARDKRPKLQELHGVPAISGKTYGKTRIVGADAVAFVWKSEKYYLLGDSMPNNAVLAPCGGSVGTGKCPWLKNSLEGKSGCLYELCSNYLKGKVNSGMLKQLPKLADLLQGLEFNTYEINLGSVKPMELTGLKEDHPMVIAWNLLRQMVDKHAKVVIRFYLINGVWGSGKSQSFSETGLTMFHSRDLMSNAKAWAKNTMHLGINQIKPGADVIVEEYPMFPVELLAMYYHISGKPLVLIGDFVQGATNLGICMPIDGELNRSFKRKWFNVVKRNSTYIQMWLTAMFYCREGCEYRMAGGGEVIFMHEPQDDNVIGFDDLLTTYHQYRETTRSCKIVMARIHSGSGQNDRKDPDLLELVKLGIDEADIVSSYVAQGMNSDTGIIYYLPEFKDKKDLLHKMHLVGITRFKRGTSYAICVNKGMDAFKSFEASLKDKSEVVSEFGVPGIFNLATGYRLKLDKSNFPDNRTTSQPEDSKEKFTGLVECLGDKLPKNFVDLTYQYGYLASALKAKNKTLLYKTNELGGNKKKFDSGNINEIVMEVSRSVDTKKYKPNDICIVLDWAPKCFDATHKVDYQSVSVETWYRAVELCVSAGYFVLAKWLSYGENLVVNTKCEPALQPGMFYYTGGKEVYHVFKPRVKIHLTTAFSYPWMLRPAVTKEDVLDMNIILPLSMDPKNLQGELTEIHGKLVYNLHGGPAFHHNSVMSIHSHIGAKHGLSKADKLLYQSPNYMRKFHMVVESADTNKLYGTVYWEENKKVSSKKIEFNYTHEKVEMVHNSKVAWSIAFSPPDGCHAPFVEVPMLEALNLAKTIPLMRLDPSKFSLPMYEVRLAAINPGINIYGWFMFAYNYSSANIITAVKYRNTTRNNYSFMTERNMRRYIYDYMDNTPSLFPEADSLHLKPLSEIVKKLPSNRKNLIMRSEFKEVTGKEVHDMFPKGDELNINGTGAAPRTICSTKVNLLKRDLPIVNAITEWCSENMNTDTIRYTGCMNAEEIGYCIQSSNSEFFDDKDIALADASARSCTLQKIQRKFLEAAVKEDSEYYQRFGNWGSLDFNVKRKMWFKGVMITVLQQIASGVAYTGNYNTFQHWVILNMVAEQYPNEKYIFTSDDLLGLHNNRDAIAYLELLARGFNWVYTGGIKHMYDVTYNSQIVLKTNEGGLILAPPIPRGIKRLMSKVHLDLNKEMKTKLYAEMYGAAHTPVLRAMRDMLEDKYGIVKQIPDRWRVANRIDVKPYARQHHVMDERYMEEWMLHRYGIEAKHWRLCESKIRRNDWDGFVEQVLQLIIYYDSDPSSKRGFTHGQGYWNDKMELMVHCPIAAIERPTSYVLGARILGISSG